MWDEDGSVEITFDKKFHAEMKRVCKHTYYYIDLRWAASCIS